MEESRPEPVNPFPTRRELRERERAEKRTITVPSARKPPETAPDGDRTTQRGAESSKANKPRTEPSTDADEQDESFPRVEGRISLLQPQKQNRKRTLPHPEKAAPETEETDTKAGPETVEPAQESQKPSPSPQKVERKADKRKRECSVDDKSEYDHLVPSKEGVRLDADLKDLSALELHEAINYYDECIGTIWHYLLRVVPAILVVALISALFFPLTVGYIIAAVALAGMPVAFIGVGFLQYKKKPYDDRRTEVIAQHGRDILDATRLRRESKAAGTV